MTYRITWADRCRAAWRRTPTWVFDAIFVAVVVFLCIALGGCGESRPTVAIDPPPMLGPPAPSPAPAKTPLEAKDLELSAAVGLVAKLTHERDELRLAPLRISLAWVDGIALIGMLAGVGLAVAALFWGLGFTWKIPAGGALACAGILATSLATSWALGHVAWIIGSVVAISLLAVIWAVRKHLTLATAAREAWRQVPDSVELQPRLERLLDQVSKGA